MAFTPSRSDAVTDGADDATVRDLAAGDALNVAVVDGAGAQITSFGGGTQYAEDTPHVSGDQLTMAGVVQQAADAALGADGDRELLQVDGSGWLKVNVKAGSAGGVSHVDDAPFTVAVDDVVPAAGMFDDAAPDSVEEGDAGVLRMSGNRNLYTQLRDATAERSAAVSAANALKVDGSAVTQPVSGTVSVTEPVSVDDNGGSLTVDATDLDIRDLAAAQDAVNVGQWIGSAAPTVGQKAMAASVPVVIASDQASVPVSSAAKEATYSYSTLGTAVTVSTILFDLFNATGSGKIVYLRKIIAFVRNTAGVVGISCTLSARRTSAAGTGGTVLGADEADTADAALPAQITARLRPAGGAGPAGVEFCGGNLYTEEGVNQQASPVVLYENGGDLAAKPYTLRETEGVRIETGALGGAGTITLIVTVTVV